MLLINEINKNEDMNKKLKGGGYRSQAMISTPILSTTIDLEDDIYGLINLSDKKENNGLFTSRDKKILTTIANQAGAALSNYELINSLKNSKTDMEKLIKSYRRFVPQQFLSLIGKTNISDVKLGDQSEQHMTILFSDIRDLEKK